MNPKDQGERNLPAKSIHYVSVLRAKYSWHSPVPNSLLGLLTGSSYRSPSSCSPCRSCLLTCFWPDLKPLNTPKMIKWPSLFVWPSCPYHSLPPQSLLSIDFYLPGDASTQGWELRLPTSNPSSDNYMLCSLGQLFKSSLLTSRTVAIMLFSRQSSE